MSDNTFGLVPPTNGPESLTNRWANEISSAPSTMEPVHVDVAMPLQDAKQTPEPTEQIPAVSATFTETDTHTAHAEHQHVNDADIVRGHDPVHGLFADLSVIKPEPITLPSSQTSITTEYTTHTTPGKEQSLIIVPDHLVDFIDRSDLIVTDKALIAVNDPALIELAEATKRDLEEAEIANTQHYVPDDLVPYIESNFLIQDVDIQGKIISSRSIASAIDKARKQKEYEDAEIFKRESQKDVLVSIMNDNAEAKVTELKAQYLTSEVLTRGLLDDPDYQHPATMIIDNLYKSNTAVCIEKRAGVGEDFHAEFFTKYEEEVKAAIADDKQALREQGKDPDEDYVEVALVKMRFHPRLMDPYLKELLSEVQQTFAKEDMEKIKLNRTKQAETNSRSRIFGNVISRFSTGFRDSTPEASTRPSLGQKIKEIDEFLEDTAASWQSANTLLETMLLDIKTRLELRGIKASEDKLQPEYNPLLLETNFITSFNDLVDFLNFAKEFRGFGADSDQNIKTCHLKGFSSADVADVIDNLAMVMGETRGPIPIKYKSTVQLKELTEGQSSKDSLLDPNLPMSRQQETKLVNSVQKRKLGFVGVIRRDRGEKPISGAFLVEYWIDDVEVLLEGQNQGVRKATLHVYHMTDSTASDVMASYVKFYAPYGKSATGNLDRKLPDAIDTINREYLNLLVDDFEEELTEKRSIAASIEPAKIDMSGVHSLIEAKKSQLIQSNPHQSSNSQGALTEVVDVEGR